MGEYDCRCNVLMKMLRSATAISLWRLECEGSSDSLRRSMTAHSIRSLRVHCHILGAEIESNNAIKAFNPPSQKRIDNVQSRIVCHGVGH